MLLILTQSTECRELLHYLSIDCHAVSMYTVHEAMADLHMQVMMYCVGAMGGAGYVHTVYTEGKLW